MIITRVQVERPDGTVIYSNLQAQIEHAGEYERVDLEQARAFDMFHVYLFWQTGVEVHRRDIVRDMVNNDPETGVLAKYRVASLVEIFAFDHQELACERVVGG